MGTHHPNYRRLRIHRTYSVRELVVLFGLHANTIRNWRRYGLEPVDDDRPVLFRGEVVAVFLQKRRQAAKQECGPGRLFCLPCRAPKDPAGGMVDYIPSTPISGSISGLCPTCERMMFRRVSLARLPDVAGGLDVQFPHGESRLREA